MSCNGLAGASHLAFGGDTLLYNAAKDDVVGGTVTSIFHFTATNMDFGIQFLSLSAFALRDAATTVSTADDLALQAQGFSSGNLFLLSAFDDNARGFGGNDRLRGFDGNDSLAGDIGNDSLAGGDGNDTLAGGSGAHTLIGGLGEDSMSAGADTVRDVFLFDKAAESAPGSARDSICQFVHHQDQINLGRIDADIKPPEIWISLGRESVQPTTQFGIPILAPIFCCKAMAISWRISRSCWSILPR